MEGIKTVRVRPKVVKSYQSRVKNFEDTTQGVVSEEGYYSALTINVVALVKQFYTLISMSAIIKPQFGRHSHDKWLEEFYAYRDNFYNKFAKMLYDYICLIVLGELRHANNFSNWGFDTLEGFGDMSRKKVFSTYRKFTKNSVLKCGEQHFNEFINPWHREYGGYNWCMIAKAGLKYGKYPNDVFIDHCFDLEHNNGCIFNKEGYLFYYPNDIQELLTTKRYCKNPIELLHWGQTKTIQSLIERACNLDIISVEMLEYFKDDPYLIRFDKPERVCEKVAVYEVTIYNNQFFADGDRKMSEYDKYDLDDFMEFYHPFIWGKEDMRELPVYRTNKDYEDGFNMNRNSHCDDYDEASNY